MINKTYRPNAYWMRGALPTVERSKDEYIGSVYGAAALAYIAMIHATEKKRKRQPEKRSPLDWLMWANYREGAPPAAGKAAMGPH